MTNKESKAQTTPLEIHSNINENFSSFMISTMNQTQAEALKRIYKNTMNVTVHCKCHHDYLTKDLIAMINAAGREANRERGLSGGGGIIGFMKPGKEEENGYEIIFRTEELLGNILKDVAARRLGLTAYIGTFSVSTRPLGVGIYAQSTSSTATTAITPTLSK